MPTSHLPFGPCQRGFTLIEVMVCLAIMAILTLAALPDLSAYVANSRLRESVNTLEASANTARGEAIRRNCSINLTVTDQVVTLSKGPNCSALASGLPRTVQLPSGVQTNLLNSNGIAVAQATFNSAGQLTPFGSTVALTTSLPHRECSADVRCPAVLIEAGGSVNVCKLGATGGACL